MKINKPYTNKEYADLAVYCNENNSHIEDKGEYLEAVENEPYIPTEEEKAANVRKQRDQYIDDIKWRVERYKSQQELGIETSDDAETYRQILGYMQYLRDIPTQEEFPDIEIKTFTVWQYETTHSADVPENSLQEEEQ